MRKAQLQTVFGHLLCNQIQSKTQKTHLCIIHRIYTHDFHQFTTAISLYKNSQSFVCKRRSKITCNNLLQLCFFWTEFKSIIIYKMWENTKRAKFNKKYTTVHALVMLPLDLGPLLFIVTDYNILYSLFHPCSLTTKNAKTVQVFVKAKSVSNWKVVQTVQVLLQQ